jgi:hypothetical protein
MVDWSMTWPWRQKHHLSPPLHPALAFELLFNLPPAVPANVELPAVDLLLKTFFLPAAPIAEDHNYTSLAIRVYAQLYSSAKGRNPQTD